MKQVESFLKIVPDNFDSEVIKEKKPVLLVCIHHDENEEEKILILNSLANSNNKNLKICLLEESQGKTIMKHYKIDGTPTYLIFKKGRIRDKILGNVDVDTLHSFVNQYVKN